MKLTKSETIELIEKGFQIILTKCVYSSFHLSNGEMNIYNVNQGYCKTLSKNMKCKLVKEKNSLEYIYFI